MRKIGTETDMNEQHDSHTNIQSYYHTYNKEASLYAFFFVESHEL